MIATFRKRLKRQKLALIVYTILHSTIVRWRFRLGKIDSITGSTHMKFSDEQSVAYCLRQFDEYFQYGRLQPSMLEGVKQVLSRTNCRSPFSIRHLGVETQRRWSDLAITRATPVLLGLFSITTLLAHRLARAGELPIRQAAWHRKMQPTFSDAIALVREQLWRR